MILFFIVWGACALTALALALRATRPLQRRMSGLAHNRGPHFVGLEGSQ